MPHARARLRLALAAIAISTLLDGCILDLDLLASGGSGGASTSTGGSGATGGTGTTSGGTGTSSGGTGTSSGGAGTGASTGTSGGCSLLDCGCAPDPTLLASGAPLADSPRGIAVTNDGLFWVNDQGGTVVHAAASGGAPQKLADANGPRTIDVNGATAVWAAAEGLFACSLPSCSGSKHMVYGAAAPASVGEVAFDGKTAVWTDLGSGVSTGKVLACALVGCNPLTLADSMIAPAGALLLGDSAFWTDQGNGNQNGNVARSPTSSQSLKQLAAGLDLPTGIAADETYVYWTEWVPAGHVRRCAYASGYCDNPEDVVPAAGGLPRPRDIRVGGGRLYWTNTDDGSIMSCPQPGCAAAKPTVHTTGRPSIQRLVVGTSCLFWTEAGNGGAVMKMAR